MSWPTDHIRATLIVFILLSAACGRGPAPAEPGTFGGLDPAVMTLLNELTAAVNADRSDAARWGRLATGLEANGLLVEAATDYAVAVSLDDKEPRWRHRQALLRARRGNWTPRSPTWNASSRWRPSTCRRAGDKGCGFWIAATPPGHRPRFRSPCRRHRAIPPATLARPWCTSRSAKTRRPSPRWRNCSPPVRATATRCNCWARPTGGLAAKTMRDSPSPWGRRDSRCGPIPGPMKSASTAAGSRPC